MAKAQNKTQSTKVDPTDFVAAVEPDRKRADAQTLLSFFNRVTGLEPVMWGSSIIGYGRYRYKYESGREGEFFLTGFSPRKQNLTVYVMPGYRYGEMKERLSRLGKHKLGKSCLYINKLADVDLAVLEEIVADGLGYMRENYETWDA
ncbi:MAG: DUF1801 domain-containing protein [Henriciella sp.]|nr:DUF1801 domain-containing protein [Henriciella sp.]